MNSYCARYSKRGQLKIQEMAFVLVAIMVFFGIVILVFFSAYLSGMKNDVNTLAEDEARQIVRKIASSPELTWADKATCGSGACIDVDKALIMKQRKSYTDFWNLDYLRIDRIYPTTGTGECTLGGYPNCRTMILVNKTDNFGATSSAYVSLCRWETANGGYVKCEIGRIYASGKGIK